MTWMALLFGVFLFLGLRERVLGGSTHVTLGVVILVVLGVVLVRLG
jgi:hypothetical protein